MTGKIFVLSGPSGGGKTTLCNRLLKISPKLVRSVSVTTRRPRQGEIEGKDYFFVSRNDFGKLRRHKGLLEWTEYNHSFYGTPLQPLREFLKKGKSVILLLDGPGARKVKRRFKEATTIFLLPPSFGDLKKRLAGRRTEKKSDLAKRLRIAEKEMSHIGWYDYIIVNDELHRAVRALRQVVRENHWGES